MSTSWTLAAGAITIPGVILAAGRTSHTTPLPRWLIATTVAGCAIAAVTALPLEPLSVSVTYLVAFAIAVAAASVDLVELRLPNPLTYGLAIGGICGLSAITILQNVGSPLRAVAGGAIFGAWMLLGALLKGGYGLGDVKLAAAVGIWLGWLSWIALAAGILVSQLLITLMLLSYRLRRKSADKETEAPLGPAMTLGLIAGALTYMT